MRAAYFYLAVTTLLLVTLQFLLAGIGIFGAGGFGAHQFVGFVLLHVCTFLMFVVGLAGGLGRPYWTFGLALFVAIAIQSSLPGLRDDAPAIAALHPLLALGIWIGAAQAVQRSRALTRSSAERSDVAVAP